MATGLKSPHPSTGVPDLESSGRPTPVTRLGETSRTLGIEVWCKRDDTLPGGSHGRKIPLLFERAEQQGARRFICLGGVGSNFCASIAEFGQARPLDVECVLIEQPWTPQVDQNLNRMREAGARIHLASRFRRQYGYPGIVATTLGLYISSWIRDRRRPFLVRPGGAAPFAALALARAVGELKEQILKGVCPEFARLFMATSSCGTLAGLLAGMAYYDLNIRIVGVRVAERHITNRMNINYLARAILKKLGSKKPLPPYDLLDQYCGDQYGAVTEAALNAVEAAGRDDLVLDTAYTGKAFAALLEQSQTTPEPGKAVLFWNTLGRPRPTESRSIVGQTHRDAVYV